MTNPDVRDVAAAYALGALDAAERAAFERALGADAALQVEVDAYREVAGWLALAARVRDLAMDLR